MPRDNITRWIPHVLIILATLISVSVFLLQTDAGIPMGDSYIHFSYARNLALHHEFSYNLGEVEGIGSTSFLWVLLLTAGQMVGILPEKSAVILGIVLLACSGNLAYIITKNALAELPHKRRIILATAAGLVTIFPGSMAWFALSGMEAILFLCLALLAIRFYGLKRWISLGLVLGLLSLTRIEGLILAGTIGIVEVVRQRRIPKELILTAIVVLAMLLPWILYLYNREGILLTASYQGRKVMVAESNTRITTHPVLGWFISINPVVYTFCWAALLLLYSSGAAGMPGPAINSKQSLLGTQIGFPVLGVMVAVICLVFFILGVCYLWRRRSALSIENPDHLPVIVLLVWTALHNLAYGLFISQVGAAGRYAVINHILFWAVLFVGAGSLIKRNLRKLSLIVVAGLLGISLVYWQNVYAANLEFSQQVRIAAAEYIDTNMPADTPIGVTDLGPIQYFARQPVIDLIGHVNKEVGPFVESGNDLIDYLQYKEICYLMLFGTVGDAGVDFAEEMGFRNDERLEIISEAKFELPVDTWRLGSEPLRNYMPAVEVYRVDWQTSGLCEMTPETE
jgi:hypothetical protein